MEGSTPIKLRIGDWCVNPAMNEISRQGETARVEGRTMRLLLYLAERAGQVVSMDELLDQVWSGVNVSPDSVYQAVTSLRRLLGDDSKQPLYIATVPRLGYRMVATVGPWSDPEAGETSNRHPENAQATPSWVGPTLAGFAGVLLLVALVAFQHFRGKVTNGTSPGSIAAAAQPQKSIAVLPFLDLTEGMQQEEFADGMTEELIDKLSKISDLRVPSPTSSFYFKGRQATVAEIAKALGVAYVLDGSVRKSGNRVRVAARLVRVDTGYVVWTETYDRPFDDLLMVQDDIAGEVAKALRASIASQARTGLVRRG